MAAETEPGFADALEGAAITAEMEGHREQIKALAKRRERVWARARRYGWSNSRLAQVAKLHHSQVDKSAQRYGNGA